MSNDPPAHPLSRSGLPRRLLPPFAALRAFEAVGRLGGIRKAGEELGIDHAAVSRHLRALEAWVGVSLIDRQRNGRLTPDGAVFHARIGAALETISQASADLTRRGDDPRLRVWCVPGFAYRWLNARLGAFSAANPDIDIEVRPTDRGPDFPRHEADADVRYVRDYEAAEGGEIQMMEIARPTVMAVAAPGLAATLPPGSPAAALLAAPLLHEDDDSEWRTWLQAHGVEAPERLAGPRLWHAHLTLDSAVRGLGVALSNDLLIGDLLRTGQLVRLEIAPAVPDIRFGSYVFRARRDRWRHPGIVRFRRWLERAARDEAANGS